MSFILFLFILNNMASIDIDEEHAIKVSVFKEAGLIMSLIQ